MEIRYPGSQEIDQIKNLWTICFDDSEEFNNYYFANRYCSKNTLGVFDPGGDVKSALQLLPYNILLNNIETAVSYIVGVSTYPEDRGMGYARDLLHRALDVARGRDEYISILLPFNYQFYRKYGWEICYEHMGYSTEVGNFHVDWGDDLSHLMRRAGLEDVEILNSCYSQHMSGYNGYVIRSLEDWNRRLVDVNIAGGDTYIFQHGDSLGYMAYMVKGNTIEIFELCHTDIGAKRALLSSITGDREDAKLSLTAPPDDISFLDMIDPRGDMSRQPFVMGRIIDVKRALASIPLDVHEDFALSLEVEDEFYKFNDASYGLSYHGKDLSIVKKYSKEADSPRPYVKLNINTLTQLFWGYISVDQADRGGLISYSHDSSLKALKLLFSPSVNMIYEDY